MSGAENALIQMTPMRPKLTRSAARIFLHGVGEDILNEGQKADGNAAKRAREAHMKKHVGCLMLFNQHLNLIVSSMNISKCNATCGSLVKKHSVV